MPHWTANKRIAILSEFWHSENIREREPMKTTEIKEFINNLVINALSNGENPWRKPWVGGASNRPRNGVTGRSYRGLNTILLGLQAQRKGYTSNRWLTFKQASENNGGVRTGEKATRIVFWSFKESQEIGPNGKPRKIPFLRMFFVFNEAQTEGVTFKNESSSLPKFNGTKIENAEAIIAGMKEPPKLIVESSAEAFYTVSTDTVVCPELSQYPNPNEYYATIFHELAHSTGHVKRLDRLKNPHLRDHSYGKEELVAEMASAMLCAEAGIDNSGTKNNSEAYLAGWVKRIKADADLVLSAAGMAQRAVSFILGEPNYGEEAPTE